MQPCRSVHAHRLFFLSWQGPVEVQGRRGRHPPLWREMLELWVSAKRVLNTGMSPCVSNKAYHGHPGADPASASLCLTALQLLGLPSHWSILLNIICTQTHTYTCTHNIHELTYTHIHLHIHMHIYIHMRTYIHTCGHAHTHINRHIHTDKLTYTQIHTHKYTYTHIFWFYLWAVLLHSLTYLIYKIQATYASTQLSVQETVMVNIMHSACFAMYCVTNLFLSCQPSPK